jgi:membrane protein
MITQLRTLILALRGFNEDKCILRASALTFFTLLSIVPVVAMAFGVAKGFGMESLLERQLAQNFEGHEEVLERVLEYSRNLLDNANGGVVAGIGVLMLLWTVIKLLGNIESSFNDIWGVKEGRSIGRKFSDYLALMLICPILLALAGSATVLVATYLKRITDFFEFYGLILTTVNLAVKTMPFLVVWLLFSFLYMFLPNTAVRLRPAIFAGLVAGISYQAVQFAYINGQFALSKSNAIYGSLAALPFFLVWIQTSWLIVLFGAELAFASQNVETYEFEPDSLRASPSFKFSAALLILSRIVRDFEKGLPPPDDRTLSADLDIPIRLTRDILFECEKCGLLSEVESESGARPMGYHPATDTDKFTVAFVVGKILGHGIDTIAQLENPGLDRTRRKVAAILADIAEREGRTHVRDV